MISPLRERPKLPRAYGSIRSRDVAQRISDAELIALLCRAEDETEAHGEASAC